MARRIGFSRPSRRSASRARRRTRRSSSIPRAITSATTSHISTGRRWRTGCASGSPHDAAHVTAGELALLVGALALAGLAKGVTGMGLPLFATPILALVFGARSAVVIMSIPTFVTNLLLILEGRDSVPVLRRIWPVAAAGVVGVIVGLNLLVRLDQNLLGLVIAALVVLVIARGHR